MKTLFTGKIFKVKQEKRMVDGKIKVYEYCEQPASVMIIPIDKQKRILLIKEERRGVKKIKVPTGWVEKGETPRKAASRELQEEIGYKPKNLKLFLKSYPSTYFIRNINVFIASKLIPSLMKNPDSGKIEIMPTTLNKTYQLSLNGKIKNEFIALAIIKLFDRVKRNEIDL